jgi:hypothetical protein
MRKLSIPELAVVAVIALGLAGAASAQICQNTCTAAISGPKQGVHTQFDTSADAILWPPNHKLDTILITAENEQGDSCDVTITSTTQDEPVTGAGSGNTSPDAANCDNSCGTDANSACIDLRAERSGQLKDGRYYHVNFNMSDPDCPTTPAMDAAIVLVPHDQGNAHLLNWVDGPQVHPSTSEACQP